ncbi:polysaccharide deacetylase family protein [soil metagenome]
MSESGNMGRKSPPLIPNRVFERYVRWSGTFGPRALAPFASTIVTRGPALVSGRPAVYLTFDDGPDPTYTERLLRLLDKHRAQATFFLRGDHTIRRPDLARAILSDGHVVGNHSWAHRDAWKVGAQTAVGDHERLQEWLRDTVGFEPVLVRPPYGHIRPAVSQWARKSNCRIILWDVMPGDFLRSADAQQTASFALRYSKPGSVVVLHEGPASARLTVPALEMMLPAFSRRGWDCLALPS